MNEKRLCQYFTPPWLASAIIDRHFGWLSAADVVVEPSCGMGAFLNAIPPEVPAYGVEVDQAVADRCRSLTGREVIVGRFQDAELPVDPTCVVGNPPFRAREIDGFLARSHGLLPADGLAGLVLPAYYFQTAGRVVRFTDEWSIQTEMIPRNVYPDLSMPLCFALFRKDRRRELVGLALYFEAAAVNAMPEPIRAIFVEQGGPMWPRVVEQALIALGGRARLPDIYDAVDGKQPSRTRWWRQVIRRTLQERFRRVGRGEWAHPNAEVA